MSEPAAISSSDGQNKGLLRNRNFLLLLGGQTISNVGDIIFDTSLTLWIATKVASGKPWAPLAVSGVLVAATIPVLVVGPAAGVFVDRWNKRKTMLLSDVMRAVLVALLLPVTGVSSVEVQIVAIYTVVLLAGVGAQFFSPARVAIIADIVDDRHLPQAASLSQLLSSLALVISPALAAPVFFSLGMQWSLMLNCFSFVVSLVAISFVRPRPPSGEGAPEHSRSFLREFAAGMQFFAGNSVLKTMLIAAVIVMLGAGAFNALSFFFLTENLHASPELFGIVGTTFGMGTLAGAILASAFASRLGLTRVFSYATVAVGVFVLVLARLSSLAPALVVLFLLGAAVPALQVTLGPLLLQVTPREIIGRVVSVMGPFTSAAEMVSMFVAGFLASTVLKDLHVTVAGLTFGPYDTILSGTGILAIAAGLYAATSLPRVVERSPGTGSGPL